NAGFQSYCRSRNSGNDFLIFFTSPSRVTLNVQDINHNFDLYTPIVPGVRQHICAWFSSTEHRFGLYLNGVDQGSSRYRGPAVPGGGTLVIGQEQDGPNLGNLDRTQAWSGKVTNFMIWPRKLNETEIFDIAHDCRCPRDYAVALTGDKVELGGQARYVPTNECPMLK
uniref:Pentraxin (PTX) domain-containing protein n=1 Tax=Ciona savignyi TaxID=51511 RepID=H2ZMD5_CIOSA